MRCESVLQPMIWSIASICMQEGSILMGLRVQKGPCVTVQEA